MTINDPEIPAEPPHGDQTTPPGVGKRPSCTLHERVHDRFAALISGLA